VNEFFFSQRRLAAVAERNPTHQNDPAIVEWASRIALDQIPGLLLVLASRWLIETTAKANELDSMAGSPPNLVTAGELASHLNLPESWVRTEERLGRIPSVRLGKYVRFRLSDVERALAQKPRRRP
jgi:excisionase family DNA binding protein